MVAGTDVLTVPAGKLKESRPRQHALRFASAGLRKPAGATFDASGALLVLDGDARTIVRIAGDASAPQVTRIPLPDLGGAAVRGLALNPADGLLYIGAPSEQRLYGIDQSGNPRRDIRRELRSARRCARLRVRAERGPDRRPGQAESVPHGCRDGVRRWTGCRDVPRAARRTRADAGADRQSANHRDVVVGPGRARHAGYCVRNRERPAGRERLRGRRGDGRGIPRRQPLAGDAAPVPSPTPARRSRRSRPNPPAWPSATRTTRCSSPTTTPMR